jgi:hypothetical protein
MQNNEQPSCHGVEEVLQKHESKVRIPLNPSPTGHKVSFLQISIFVEKHKFLRG